MSRAETTPEIGAVVGGAQRVEVELGVLGGRLRDQALLAQLLLPGVVALELAEVGIGLRQFEPQPVAVEARQHLARLDDIAFLDIDLPHLAADLGDDHCLLVRLDRGRARVDRDDGRALDQLYLDGHGRVRLFILLGRFLGLAVAAARSDRERCGGGQRQCQSGEGARRRGQVATVGHGSYPGQTRWRDPRAV